MSQDFSLPSSTNEVLSTALVTMIPDAIRALQSQFSGSSAPSTTVPYMFWADTSGAGVLKMRNAGDTDWITLGPLAGPWASMVTKHDFGNLSATAQEYVFAAPVAGNVRRLRIVGNTATTSSSGNEWTFMLANLTQTLDLFSGTPGTYTNVSGVGGGSELAADTEEIYTCDQNILIAAGDVIELTITKTGSPTSPINRIQAFLDVDTIPV